MINSGIHFIKCVDTFTGRQFERCRLAFDKRQGAQDWTRDVAQITCFKQLYCDRTMCYKGFENINMTRNSGKAQETCDFASNKFMFYTSGDIR